MLLNFSGNVVSDLESSREHAVRATYPSLVVNSQIYQVIGGSNSNIRGNNTFRDHTDHE